MPRFLAGWLLSLAGTAIGLVLCDVLLAGFSIDYPKGFVWALVIFAVLEALLKPLVFRVVRRNANSVLALTGLISSFLALLVTVVFVHGIDIDGIATWIAATVILWLLGMLIWVIPGPWRDHQRAAGRS